VEYFPISKNSNRDLKELRLIYFGHEKNGQNEMSTAKKSNETLGKFFTFYSVS
jgi:hypothetical protein